MPSTRRAGARDVKRGNVLLGPDDHVLVTDFGLAKQVLSRGGGRGVRPMRTDARLRGAEQIRGMRVDADLDVYAMGGLLYMLAGLAPFSEHEGRGGSRRTSPVASTHRRCGPGSRRRSMRSSTARWRRTRRIGTRPRETWAVPRPAVRDRDPAQAERMVAVGAAAPDNGAKTSTRAGAPTTDGPVGDGPARPGRARIIAGAASVAVIVAGVVVALLLAPGWVGPAWLIERPERGRKRRRDDRERRAAATGSPSGRAASGCRALRDRLTQLDGGRWPCTRGQLGGRQDGRAGGDEHGCGSLAPAARLIVRLDRRGALAGRWRSRATTAIDSYIELPSGSPCAARPTCPACATTRDAPAHREVRGPGAGARSPQRPTAYGGAPRHADGGASGRYRRPRDGARAPAPAAYDLAYGAGYAWARLHTDEVARIAPGRAGRIDHRAARSEQVRSPAVACSSRGSSIT